MLELVAGIFDLNVGWKRWSNVERKPSQTELDGGTDRHQRFADATLQTFTKTALFFDYILIQKQVLIFYVSTSL